MGIRTGTLADPQELATKYTGLNIREIEYEIKRR